MTEGIEDQLLDSNATVTGVDKGQHRKENKRNRLLKTNMQVSKYYWSHHTCEFSIPSTNQGPKTYKGSMFTEGLALHHPDAGKLLQFSTKGCPTMTGKLWTLNQMEEAIDRGLHVSTLQPVAMKITSEEVEAKENKGQCKVVFWNSIKYNLPDELKISPIDMIPHKS